VPEPTATTTKVKEEEDDNNRGKSKECKQGAPPQSNITTNRLLQTQAKIFYDVASWALTQISIDFCMFPFLVLEFSCSFRVSTDLWWWVQVGCLVLVLADRQRLLKPFKEGKVL